MEIFHYHLFFFHLIQALQLFQFGMQTQSDNFNNWEPKVAHCKTFGHPFFKGNHNILNL